jgi:hypothetical protein
MMQDRNRPLIAGGQGRTPADLTESISTPLWLALTLVQLGAVAVGVGMVYDAGGPLLAAVVALACAAAWWCGFGCGRDGS